MTSIIDKMILKVRRVGGSLSIIVPRDIATLYNIDVDSGFEVIPVSKDELTLRFKRQPEK